MLIIMAEIHKIHVRIANRENPGLEVIKLFSCLTQLSMKFQLAKTEVLKNNDFSCLRIIRHCIYPADKC